MIMCMKMCLHDSTDYTRDRNICLGSCGHLGGQIVNKAKQVVRVWYHWYSTPAPSTEMDTHEGPCTPHELVFKNLSQ